MGPNEWNKSLEFMQNDEGDNVAIESHEAEVARYNRCGMFEVSDPDFWMELRHFDEDPLAHDEADGVDLDRFGRHQPNFEDWHMNHEIALLMVMQKFFTEMNTLERIALCANEINFQGVKLDTPQACRSHTNAHLCRC